MFRVRDRFRPMEFPAAHLLTAARRLLFAFLLAAVPLFGWAQHSSPDWVGTTTNAPLYYAGSFYGNSVACAGDIDADGDDEILIAEPAFETSPGVPNGKIALHLGSPTGIASPATWTF